jgi:hypothetical protein
VEAAGGAAGRDRVRGRVTGEGAAVEDEGQHRQGVLLHVQKSDRWGEDIAGQTLYR